MIQWLKYNLTTLPQSQYDVIKRIIQYKLHPKHKNIDTSIFYWSQILTWYEEFELWNASKFTFTCKWMKANVDKCSAGATLASIKQLTKGSYSRVTATLKTSSHSKLIFWNHM